MGSTLTKKMKLTVGWNANNAEKGMKKMESRMGTMKKAVLGLVAAFGLWKLGGIAKDAVLTAARTQVLGTALRVVGTSAGYSERFLNLTERAITRLGITTQEARLLMTRFIQSNLELADATKIARAAQDLAVISGQNSSEAAATLTRAIVAQRPILLKQFGIIINLNDLFAKLAKELNKTRSQLTEVEKKQGFLNAILEAASRVSGVYTAAMRDVGKQLTSLPRHIQEAKNAFGVILLPVMKEVVNFIKQFAKKIKSISEDADMQGFREKIKRLADMIKTLGEKAINFIEHGGQKFLDFMISLAENPLTRFVVGNLANIFMIAFLARMLFYVNSLNVALTGTSLASLLKGGAAGISRLAAPAAAVGLAHGVAGAGIAGAGATATVAASAMAIAPVVIAALAIIGVGVILAMFTMDAEGKNKISRDATFRVHRDPNLAREFKGEVNPTTMELVAFADQIKDLIALQETSDFKKLTERKALTTGLFDAEMIKINAQKALFEFNEGFRKIREAKFAKSQNAAMLVLEQGIAKREREQADIDAAKALENKQLQFQNKLELIAVQGNEELRIAVEADQMKQALEQEFADSKLTNRTTLNAALAAIDEQARKDLAKDEMTAQKRLEMHATIFYDKMTIDGREFGAGRVSLGRAVGAALIETAGATAAAELEIMAKNAIIAAGIAMAHGNFGKAAALTAAAAAAGFAAGAIEGFAEERADAARNTGGGGDRFAGDVDSDRSGRRTGTVITGAEQHITISPTLIFQGETIIIGGGDIAAVEEAIGAAAVRAVQDALITGEIEVNA